jgi:ribonuclease VapC
MTLVVDTSALTAVVLGEPDAETYLATMVARIGDLTVSAPTLLEARIVVEAKQGPGAAKDLDLLLGTLQVTIAPADEALIEVATAAWRRFGKGRHPAALNFGDCFSYALARQLGAPLLFKGRDFSQTDITAG